MALTRTGVRLVGRLGSKVVTSAFALALAAAGFALAVTSSAQNFVPSAGRGSAAAHAHTIASTTVPATTSTTAPPGSTTLPPCSSADTNHGAYVSGVAHTHPGGAVVSAAARSDCGKPPSATGTPPATGTTAPGDDHSDGTEPPETEPTEPQCTTTTTAPVTTTTQGTTDDHSGDDHSTSGSHDSGATAGHDGSGDSAPTSQDC